MPPKYNKMTQLTIDASFRKEDGGSSRPSQDQTIEESINLLQNVDCLEREANKLYTDISDLEAKLTNTRSKLYDDILHPRDTMKVAPDPSNMENYSIKLNHKFYEFTGVSIKKMAHNTITVFFYIKHDDWASDIRPYWLKIENGETPEVISYDLPFRVDMKEIQAKRPISTNDNLFGFINYVRRCIESYFERRQQAHELEKALNPAHAKVTMDMQYMLIQIKLLGRKSAPEKRFSIWYREDATLPHRCIVRILDGGHDELVKNLTMNLKVLTAKPLPEAFIEGTQKYVNFESSSDESPSESESDMAADVPDLKSWFYPPKRARRKTGARSKSGSVGGRRPLKQHDEVPDGSVSGPSPAKRPTKTTGNDRVPARKRIATPNKFETINWMRDARSSRRTDVRNANHAEKNTSVESNKPKKNLDVRNSVRKSVYFNLSELPQQERIAEPQRAKSSQSATRNGTQSIMTKFLKPFDGSSETNIGGPLAKISKPRERNVPSLVYENEFESEGSDDQTAWSLHSAETLSREPLIGRK